MIRCPFCNNESYLFSEKLKKKERWKYYTCNKCFLLFLNPFPTMRFLETYYGKYDYAFQTETQTKLRNQAKKILTELIKLNKSGSRLLDIGFGHGYLLDEANKKGMKTFGIEPSRQLFKKFLENHQSDNVSNIDLDKFIATNKSKYDYIVLSHIIEHITNPQNVINALKKCLNTNGIVFIETPNIDSYLFYAEKDNYTFLTPPDHVMLYSPNAIEECVRKTGMKIVALKTYSYPEYFAPIIKSIIYSLFNMNNQETIAEEKSVEVRMANIAYKRGRQIISLFKHIIVNLFANMFLAVPDFKQKGAILEVYLKNQ